MFSSSAGTRADAIALNLEVENERTLLEFDAAEDRAFSVGSSPHADVRVRRPGVPPVAFYLERRRDAIWLVPGYRRSSLRVDAAYVIAPCRLGRSARIEFSRVRARVAVRTANAAAFGEAEVDESPTVLNESTRRWRLAYLAALPDAGDRTEIDALPARAVVEPGVSRDPSRDRELSSIPPHLRRSRPRIRRDNARAAPVKAPSPPHLWVSLEQRPLEAALLILLIGLVILAAALAAASFLRLR